MSVLTSLNNPLKIAAVNIPGSQGLIGMTLCPGKHQRNALSGHFQRDLQLDLDVIKCWGASAVVSLMSDEELASLQVETLGAEVEAREMHWFQLPLTDQALPGEMFERQWVYAGLLLRTLLRQGQRILIHCRSGLGRTGLIAARLLIELAMPAADAFAAVRRARPGCLETASQEHYLSAIQVMNNDIWLDRVLGCPAGGAVGDAFGHAVEPETLATLRQLGEGRVEAASPAIDDTTQACIRMLEMTHELHVLGYQKIRIFPSMAPSGCHWRVQWAPDTAFESVVEPPETLREQESVRYSSGAGWEPFGWHGVRQLSATEMAQQFVRQFPALAQAGFGDDWAYAGWFTRLLGEARKGRLPYFLADWETDLSRAVPMSQGGSFPLPPERPNRAR